MRYLKRYESLEDIKSICQKWGIKNYSINADGSIDVDSSVDLHDRGLTKLPLKFKNVLAIERLQKYHYFSCSSNKLTTLEGCPKSVSGDFYCFYNRLTNLEGCPKLIGGSFYCDDNKIETFDGLNFINIVGNFSCNGNLISYIWRLFSDHTKFEFFNDCDIIREGRVIILDRLNFFLNCIGKEAVTEVEGYKCI